MVGKRSGKALLREEGLERTDNNMELTSWTQVNMINQKNYYTEYLKRDDQILPLRLLQEERRDRMIVKAKDKDRIRNQDNSNEVNGSGADLEMDEDAGDDAGEALNEEDASGAKVIVIHPGSQNLRIGLANDALAKSTPMVIARRFKQSEVEENGGEPTPKRRKLEDGNKLTPEKLFGEDFSKEFKKMGDDLKVHMRSNKRRVLPNSKELIVNYNKRAPPETIKEHNDPLRIDWTELPSDARDAPIYFTGMAALRLPEQSKPRYRLFWPLQYGWYNEKDYSDKNDLFDDMSTIIEEAIKTELNLPKKRDWAHFSCVFVIPDLYEKRYVSQVLDMLMRDFGFYKVAFIQESLAATFGAGYVQACVVDIGAQKTSVCCVEEGMCVDNSRINLKFGGADVTETFIRMMLHDHFPYQDINLRTRYGYLLAEELKRKFCTLNEAEISPQLFDFHVRASGQDTRKYTFKTYDEILLAPQGYYHPDIFDNSRKLEGRRKLIEPSVDLYDGEPNDPVSSAQSAVISLIAPSTQAEVSVDNRPTATTNGSTITKPTALPKLNEVDRASTSAVGTPVPEDEETSMAIGESGAGPDVQETSIRDDILPIIALDTAILTSIAHGARNDERRTRDFLGSIMVIGGGSQVPGFYAFLEEKLKEVRPGFAKDIMIGTPPRELDPQGVVWKGASVFGKLSGTNDSWIGRVEYDRLGVRVLPYKCMWSW